jgi:UDPglucose 6-dehydrogenase
MKIGIVGQGFVGSAVYAGFKNYFNVETFDLNKKSTCDSLKTLVEKSQFIFICLPTPMEKDGKCHIGIVENVISEINSISTKKILIVKSTIPPGTTEKWNKKYKNVDIVFNPEFLTEANALDDFKNQTRIVLGGTRKSNARVKRLFTKAFPKVPVIHTSSTIAEMVKYVTNCFLATKVSFANEMYQICDYLKIDYDKVIEYAKYDDRLGYSHWNVPGPDGDFGYGGHCFPKDVKALINVAMELESNITPTILNATNSKNDEVRKNRDWEQQKGRAVI